MFEKNLNDLVRGLRNSKNTESKYVTECLDEIKQELRQENMAIKANAVLKLSYIQMIGYDVSWAAFNIIEVMSSQKFTHKRIAYMAASQSFHSDLDVLMLATNLIKKDMNSQNQYDAGVAMVGLSCFVSPDLARDLANDIMSMMVSSRPYIRKRAILLMYKVFLNFPESLRPAFPRLKERLEDEEQGVQCAAVNVICELARKNPKNYLALAPLFFKLMTTSSNNWMLIKIIKLFGALCPLEPRLGKKLLEPLTSLIHSTSAMSLLYECINTVVAGVPDHQPSLQLCVTKLRLLIEDPDQNLKYLGLLLLNKILKTQPKLVLGHQDIILLCLDSHDESIRYRALDLISGMVTKKTLVDIVKKLMIHMEKSEGSIYRDELLSKIIKMCSQCNYQFITSFEWYIDILLQLSAVEGTKHGKMIANQMLDVAIRVKMVRKYAVPLFATLLGRPAYMTGTCEKNSSCEVLFAAAWVVGEFAEHLSEISTVLDWVVHPRVTSLPGHVQCVYIQAVGKLFSVILSKCEDEDMDGEDSEVNTISEKLIDALPVFTQSSDLEVQDRSCCILQLIKLVIKMKNDGVKCANDVKALFAEDLLPVAPQAQNKVPVPEGLDLDKWINEPLSEEEDSDDIDDIKPFFSDEKANSTYQHPSEKYEEPDPEELEKAREIRKLFQESNPHYLKVVDSPTKTKDVSVDDIPVKELDSSISLTLDDGFEFREKKKKGRKGRKGKKGHEEEDDSIPAQAAYEIAPVLDLEGENNTNGIINNDTSGDVHNLLNVDLNTPLGDHEILPVAQHRVVENKPVVEKLKVKEKKTKKVKKGKAVKEAKKHKHKSSVDLATNDDVEKPVKKEKIQKGKKKKIPEKENKEEDGQQTTLLAVASNYAKEAKESDSMEFWLSPASSPGVLSPELQERTSPDSQAKPKIQEDEPKPKLFIPVPESDPNKEVSPETGPEKKLKKKKRETLAKEKKESKKQRSKEKKHKDEEITVDVAIEETPAEDANVSVDMMMDVDDVQPDPWNLYSLLGEDGNLKLLNEIRVHPQNPSQVICSIIFKNLTSNHIQKLEFNVIDSLNMKLVRQDGVSHQDPVLVPFQLLPSMTNEGQFAFTVGSCVMCQYLRGTLTYIVKDGESSTSGKIDFRILFPVCIYVQPKPISSQEYTSLLASGDLTEKQSSQITLEKDVTLEHLMEAITLKMKLIVVEHIDHGASLFGYTIQDHPICLLVKLVNTTSVTIDGKSTDFQLLSSILKEIKDVVDGL